MPRRLPPLNALVVFEAAARHLSFTRASEEMHVTQAAVSHQIVLTKCDEVKPADLAGCIAAVEAAVAKRPAAFPTVLATSSHDGKGIPELRAAIARLLAERRL